MVTVVLAMPIERREAVVFGEDVLGHLLQHRRPTRCPRHESCFASGTCKHPDGRLSFALTNPVSPETTHPTPGVRPNMNANRPLVMSVLVVAISALGPREANAQQKGPVPDGTYTLSKISSGSLIQLGTLEIKNSTYRFGSEGKFESFTINDKGTITWSKGLSFLPDGWTHVRSEYMGKTKEGKPLIHIYYKSARGAQDLIDALKE